MNWDHFKNFQSSPLNLSILIERLYKEISRSLTHECANTEKKRGETLRLLFYVLSYPLFLVISLCDVAYH